MDDHSRLTDCIRYFVGVANNSGCDTCLFVRCSVNYGQRRFTVNRVPDVGDMGQADRKVQRFTEYSQLGAAGRQLSTLAELDQKLGRLVAARDDLDLRRLEHVLVDVRDTQRRLEDAFLRATEIGTSGGAQATAVAVPASPESIGERVLNRLLVLGYEKVQIVTRQEKLAELARRDGEVLVEARRDGVLHKGRVVLRGGRLTSVEIHPGRDPFRNGTLRPRCLALEKIKTNAGSG